MKQNIRLIAFLSFVGIFLFPANIFAQSSLPIGAPKACPVKIDVWPGDANNDSTLDNADLLPIGLYFGKHGLGRDSVSNIFQADSAEDWGMLQHNLSDIKHADCNGDSTVTMDDTLAMNLNFGMARPVFITTHPFDNNIVRGLTSGGLHIETADTIYNAGDWVTAEVWLGDSVTQVNNLYGIAFTVSYDASLVEPGTESITYPASWLGIPGPTALKFSKVDNSTSLAYGAITRYDHLNASGFGKIAYFKFRLAQDISVPSLMDLSFYKVYANDSSGTPVVFNAPSHTIHINTFVGINELEQASSFSISPNPFSTFGTLHFKEPQENAVARITDLAGKEIRTMKFSGRDLTIEKADLAPGIYLVQVITKQSTGVKKIVIQ